MKIKDSQTKQLQKFIKKGGKVKMQTMTYTWKPPTKEEIAAQEKDVRKHQHSKMRELAMFLEGVKQSRFDGKIDHEHLSTLWSVIHKMRNEI